MKKILFVVALITIIYACGQKSGNEALKPIGMESPKASANPKGVGEIKNVKLNNPLDQSMVDRGKMIYELKCAACHKLSGARVVGPSWEGLTERRQPEWIMNMITNVDMMLAEDAEAQKLLEECLTRMPNQNVSIGDARDILEFIYQNDQDQKNK